MGSAAAAVAVLHMKDSQPQSLTTGHARRPRSTRIGENALLHPHVSIPSLIDPRCASIPAAS
jgi:hypothetical protein